MKSHPDHNAETDREFLLSILLRRDELEDTEADAFAGMMERCANGSILTERQRQWVEGVAKRLDIVEPAANLVSRGLVPRGDEVPTPEILKRANLPMKPPGWRRP